MSAGAPPSGAPAAEAPGTPATPVPTVRRKRNTGAIVAVVLVIIIVAGVLVVGYQQKWFGGSTSKSEASCTTGVTLSGNGAQIINPIMSVWTTDYATQSGNQVNYDDGGSGTGITDFSENPPLIDFAVADNPLSSTERAAMPGTPLSIPIVGGAITVIYNLPGLTGHLNLTGLVLAEIYSGTIADWNDAAIAALNPGVNLPSNPITTVHRVDSAGTTYVFTTLLSDDSSSWASSVGTGLLPSWPSKPVQVGVKGNSLMLSTVGGNAYYIGYSDLTDTLTYSASTLQYAAVQNPAGTFVAPTLANTASAINDVLASATLPTSASSNWYNLSMVNAKGTNDYPLATFIYLYIYQNASKGYSPSQTKTQVLIQWVDYLLSPAAQALTDATSPTQLYYVALPASVIAVDTAGLQTITFNGASIPACK